MSSPVLYCPVGCLRDRQRTVAGAGAHDTRAGGGERQPEGGIQPPADCGWGASAQPAGGGLVLGNNRQGNSVLCRLWQTPMLR